MRCPHGWADPSHCLNCTASAFDRIAELEAELARHRGTCRLFKDRAEKAEADADRIARELQPLQEENAFLKAEVERLHAICRWPIFCGIKEASP